MSSVDLRIGEAGRHRIDGERLSAILASRQRLLQMLWGAGLFTGDVLLNLAAFMLAHWVRFIAPDDGAAALGLEHYLRMGLLISLTTSALLALHGLYDGEHLVDWPARLYLIASAVAIALVLGVTASYFLGDERFSRLWFAAGWAFATVGLALWRPLALRLYAALRTIIAPADRVLIVGANRLGRQMVRELAQQYRVVGYVDNGSDIGKDDGEHCPLLGPIAQLEHIVAAFAVDEIFIALPRDRHEQVRRIIDRGFRRSVKVKFLPELSELLPQRFEVHHVAGKPYIGFASAARVSWLKRATDLVVGSILLLAALPLFAVIALAIRLDSPGPVFYRQERVGKHGRRFWMLKFRSMCQEADRLLGELRDRNEASGPLFKIRRDPRITRVGSLLRRFSLDELPQLVNVVRGEMSLVGPRPPIPAEVETYEDWQHGRLRAVPGMTGLWQVSGRSEVPFPDMVRLDLYYVRNWSLRLDLEIILRTIPAVVSNRGAY